MASDPSPGVVPTVSAIDIGAFLHRGCRGAGDLQLLSDQQGSVSGNELATRSAGLAAALAKLGINRDEPVLLAPMDGIQRIVSYWALLRLGAVPVVVDQTSAFSAVVDLTGCKAAIANTEQVAELSASGITRGIAVGGKVSADGWSGYDDAIKTAASAPPDQRQTAIDYDLCALVPWQQSDGSIALARRTHRAVAISGGVAALYHGASPGLKLLVTLPVDNRLLEVLLFSVLCGNAQAYLVNDSDDEAIADTIARVKPTTVISTLDTATGLTAALPAGVHQPVLWNLQLSLAEASRGDEIRRWRNDLPSGWLGQALCGEAATGGIAVWYEPEGRWHPLPTVGIHPTAGDGELFLRSPQLSAGFSQEGDNGQTCGGGWFHTGVAAEIGTDGFLVTGTAQSQAQSQSAATNQTSGAVNPADITTMTAIDIGAFMDYGSAFHRHRPMLQVDDRHIGTDEITRRSQSLSAGLVQQHGIRRGDRVAMLLHNGNEFLEVYWACARIGAVVIPVNFRLQPAEINYILNDSGARLLIAEPEHQVFHQALLADSPTLEAILTTDPTANGDGDYEALIAASEPLAIEAVDGGALDRDPCSILYTAGTTGFPKGAVRTHKAVLWYILNAAAMSAPGDRGEAYLAVPPMFHIAGHETRLPMTVMRGSVMVILTAFNPRQVLDFIEKERVSSMFVPPTMGHVMLQTMAEGKWDLSSWREWISASAPLPAPVRDRAVELLPHLEFSNSLGMTEAGVLASASGDILNRKVSSCVGRAAPTVDMAIIDPDGNEVAIGDSGEICIRSPQIIEEYWKNPEATANAMAGDRFHTGDVGRLDDERHLIVLDRIKDMIITGGENVYAPEVESQLLSMAELADASVFGLSDSKWGETVAAAVVNGGGEISDREIIERCRERIAHYKCPTQVFFVEALPRNAMGKVMKAKLREQFSKP